MRFVTFGEIMLRLSAPSHLRLNQTSILETAFGGGEANVAVSLAILGEEASFITRLPRNDLAEACVQRLRGLGVNTTDILWGGDRMGIYFLESGAAQRASVVTYDRAHSAISEIDPAELDWPGLLNQADWFHFTGITPALSDRAAQATLEGAQAAQKLGLTVSCDLNYRQKLWTSEKAGRMMSAMMRHVDIFISNEHDAEKLFGIKASTTEAQTDHHRCTEVARKLMDQFPFKGVALTLRQSTSASKNGWSGLYLVQDQVHFSRPYDIQVIDRVGTGDSFAAGLIYALGKNKTPQDVIEFAVAAGCLKHSIPGDFNLARLSEIEALAAGEGSGRVQR